MKFNSDIDIDLGNRDKLLSLIKHTHAKMYSNNEIRRHNSGVYVTDIPYDPVHDMCALDYVEAENRGYFKLDLLNVHVYTLVKDENHLRELMKEPDWSKLSDKNFVEQLVHLSNHYNTLQKMREPVNSIPRLAMFLALIRPSKKHLIGRPWAEIAQTIWDRDSDGYTFKKSHSLAYSMLVVVHMNLLSEHGT